MKNKTYKFASVIFGMVIVACLFFFMGWITASAYYASMVIDISTKVLNLSQEQSAKFMDYLYQFGGIIMRKLV